MSFGLRPHSIPPNSPRSAQCLPGLFRLDRRNALDTMPLNSRGVMARTEALLEGLVQALQSNCGDLYGACRANSVSMMFVRTWMKDDKDVAEALAEAERVGGYGLESEAIRRAVYGEEKGVYFKGERIGTEYVRSDGLLNKLMEGKLPERYRKGADAAGITINGGQAQINIMPRADNYDEWLRMKSSTLALRDAQAALPAPDDIIDVECIPVPDNPFEALGL